MINIFSVGIQNAQESNVHITCAKNDAQKVYRAFEEALTNDFSAYNSISLFDINADTFRKVIKSLTKTIDYEDIFVIYFSGHGSINHSSTSTFSFHFTDENLDLVALTNDLFKIKGKVLLILDTCHSEYAITISNSSDVSIKSRFFVLASTEYYSYSHFNANGSYFTEHLCNALIYLSKKGDEISISNIKEYFDNQNKKIYVGLGTESTNLILKKCYSNEEYPHFHSRFLTLSNSCEYKIREMAWYSLENFPSIALIEIIKNYINNEVYEPSWLVRRAIGNIISNLRGYEETIQNLFDEHIKSLNWMKITILLIAMRYSLKNHRNILENIIINSNLNMDVIWLANLYYFDLVNIDVSIIMKSNLTKTEWGNLEIFKHLSKNYSLYDSYQIIRSYINSDLLSKVELDWSLMEGKEHTCLYKQLENNILIKVLYNKRSRGRTPNAKNKWLFSAIYGNWRDYINIDIRDYLENTHPKVIKKELKELQMLPQYQMKMAIFDFFSHESVFFKEYKDYLKWGLNDGHPWVKREAIKAFSDYPDIIKGELSVIEINKHLYPGYLDLIIEISSVCPDICINTVIETNSLSESEVIALEKNSVNIT